MAYSLPITPYYYCHFPPGAVCRVFGGRVRVTWKCILCGGKLNKKVTLSDFITPFRLKFVLLKFVCFFHGFHINPIEGKYRINSNALSLNRLAFKNSNTSVIMSRSSTDNYHQFVKQIPSHSPKTSLNLNAIAKGK